MSFIDSLVADYKLNQSLLDETNPKQSKPYSPDVDGQTITKVYKDTVYTLDSPSKRQTTAKPISLRAGASQRDIHLLNVLWRTNKRLTFVTSHTQDEKEQAKAETLGLFCWKDENAEHSTMQELIPTAKSALFAFRQRLPVILNSCDQSVQFSLLNEFYLHALIESKPGLHLFIVPKEVHGEVVKNLSSFYWKRAIFPIWKYLLKDPACHEIIMRKTVHLLQETLTWKKPLDSKKYDYDTIGSVLALISLLPLNQAATRLITANKLSSQETMQKIRLAATNFVKYHYYIEDLAQKITSAVDEVIAYLQSNYRGSDISFIDILENLKQRINDDKSNISDNVSQALSGLTWWSHAKIQALYLLAGKICALQANEERLIETQEYPSREKLLTFIQSMPHRLGHTTRIIPVGHDPAETIEPCERPVRSLFVYGYDATSGTVWKRICEMARTHLLQTEKNFPAEPTPLIAQFSEQATTLLDSSR